MLADLATRAHLSLQRVQRGAMHGGECDARRRRQCKASGVGEKISNCPGDLYVLWREYALGVNGGKPARDYSPSERGANRYAYSRRKNFWNAICSLTTKGYTADTAIDKVYEVYGKSKSVTAILDAMIADKQARIERF